MLLSLINGTPGAYHWVQFKGNHFIQQAGTYIDLDNKNVFVIYHVRVADAFHSKGIGTYIYQIILRTFKERGFSRGLIYTSADNISNQKSISKLGFKEDFEIYSIQFGKKFYHFLNRDKFNRWLK